ncbi:MAG: prolipoprotein diacylglyceryl transferase, partial [Alkalinema sp. RL_2_19]|nr:prolipoprotein diacylglyceryl transferase [Alkalinema sp. RL_2_19]
NMVKNVGAGFVFFGSLLFAVPATIWYFKKQKWPVIPMLDLIAITTLIVHACGRVGCFFAGCFRVLPSQQRSRLARQLMTNISNHPSPITKFVD